MTGADTNTETERPKSEPWRRSNGQFGPNNPGRPPGTKNRINAEMLAGLGDMRGPALAVLKAELEKGNLRAACYVLDRFLPGERAVALDRVDPASVTEALVAGDITAIEATRMANTFKTISDASTVQEIAAKVDELEAWIAQHRGGNIG